MDKKDLPIDVLIASGAGLLGSFLPWLSVSGFGVVGSFGNGWNAAVFGIPIALSVLAIVAVGVFAILKANKQWEAPWELNLGLSIGGVALPLLFIIIWFGRMGGNAAFGAYLTAAAGGYLTYLFASKKGSLWKGGGGSGGGSGGGGSE